MTIAYKIEVLDELMADSEYSARLERCRTSREVELLIREYAEKRKKKRE